MRNQHGSGPLVLPSSRRGVYTREERGLGRSWPEEIDKSPGKGEMGAGSWEEKEYRWMHLDLKKWR